MKRPVKEGTMRLTALLCVQASVFALASLRLPAQAGEDRVEVNISHPVECVITGELEARVYIYNRTDAEQTYKGEVADEKGNLILSGAWDLVVEEVKDDQVVSAKPLRPGRRPAGTQHTLKPRGHNHWKWNMPLKKLVDHPGNYRFRVSQGPYSNTGRLFRVVERPGAPDWISLTYTPEERSYFIGQPIAVHFELKNNGTDEFHFEEGGDYRGANRHLRWAFAAENEKGEKAVDPRPNQPCFGGMGQSDPHVKPGGAYKKNLPLLAYLRFPGPGRYRVRAYQAMGFGEPVKGLKTAGYWGAYAYGNSFEIQLRLPTEEEARGLLRSLLGQEKHERGRRFSSLYHPCYLEPLGELLAAETDTERIQALMAGVGSIVTVQSTRRLIALAQDKRGAVRVATLRHLSWRLPDPRDTGKAKHDSPFRFYSPAGRIQDVKASWDEALRPRLLAILKKGLHSVALDEVATCAYCLGALGETESASLLAEAGDRVAPRAPVPEPNARCVNQIASAASLLAQLGAKPCRADQRSTPGRLALWANMVRAKQEYRTGQWEDIILHMMNLDCPVTRMAAIRWLPEDFSKRRRIPWKKLFGERDRQIWWHALQIARQTFPPELKAIAQEVLKETSDQRKRREFGNLLKEIDTRDSQAPLSRRWLPRGEWSPWGGTSAAWRATDEARRRGVAGPRPSASRSLPLALLRKQSATQSRQGQGSARRARFSFSSRVPTKIGVALHA